ncbi:hypothetical protein AMST5_02157 [freshwater sediment metagenome]|uniref:Uncharacterized protein n=1 Tax=freshwater sediment metagenome TaxID=556182 RepID=A0AA48RAT8_9ZZZZ
MSATEAPGDRSKLVKNFRVRTPNNRSKVTNGSKLMPGLDGRSVWGRRFYDLCASHAADAGGPEILSEAQLSLIRRASALEVTLERFELDMAEGRDVDLDLYARAAGHLRRILETVGVGRVAKDTTPTIAHIVAQYDVLQAEPASAPTPRGATTLPPASPMPTSGHGCPGATHAEPNAEAAE